MERCIHCAALIVTKVISPGSQITWHYIGVQVIGIQINRYSNIFINRYSKYKNKLHLKTAIPDTKNSVI